MNFEVSYNTDIGIRKNTNQDSVAVKVINTAEGMIAFGIVCDGMGGLSKGELASKEVITTFCDWFDHIFISDLKSDSFSEDRLKEQWNDIIQEQNEKLGNYGSNNNLMLGTTVSAILIYRGNYYITHVGDSRIYEILSDDSTQITSDQTFVAREIAMGRMTPEQAETDPRRSVLLQCVGASRVVEPDFLVGTVKSDAVYMLCSDGFRHKITDQEMIEYIGPQVGGEERLKYGCIYLTELVKNRREVDNITVAVIKTI